MTQTHFLALDLGAESGRAELVTLAEGQVQLQELHRWPNRPVQMGPTLYWDLPYLLAEMLVGMRRCAESGCVLSGISVDTWGVDFGLLGDDGRLLGNPVHYRDSRTQGIHDYSNRVMPTEAIFRATGYEPWAISSLFQLLAMQRDNWPTLKLASTFLNMPDLFHYLLTGRAMSEMSIANTTNLMGVDCRWSRDIINQFGLSPEMFGPLVPPATVVGHLTDSVRSQTGLGEVPVIATCGHDTSAALAAVPADGDNWAFLSCGTWSILGTLVDQPIATQRCMELGFTNEYTIGGWYIARNILGLWLVQELRRKWDAPVDRWDYVRMTAEASAVRTDAMIDVSHASLLAPSDMEAAVVSLLSKDDQPTPQSRGELVRCVLQSLALEYACRLDSVSELTGRRPQTLYMVGGGIKNELLCQLTADACGLAVHAGADQCTALGNALGQAMALGVLKSPDEIRQVMRQSTASRLFEPRDSGLWQDRKQAYKRLKQRS